MRPQPIGCGNYDFLVKFLDFLKASMRPQPIGCGNVERRIAAKKAKELQ